jgi:hypothetical protein
MIVNRVRFLLFKFPGPYIGFVNEKQSPLALLRDILSQ